MFERDLPGENLHGLSFQTASALPLETCETINGAWGYNMNDHKYKTPTQIHQLLVGAAGRNANLLLNVGPMPTGKIQPEFTDSLAVVGKWLEANGRSVYGTRGGPLKPQTWGVTTENASSVFVHLFNKPSEESVFIPGKYKKASVLNGAAVKAKIEKDGMRIMVADVPVGTQVIELIK